MNRTLRAVLELLALVSFITVVCIAADMIRGAI